MRIFCNRDTDDYIVKNAVIEQIYTVDHIQLLDALADLNIVPDEAVESTTIVATKYDGDGLEPAAAATVK